MHLFAICTAGVEDPEGRKQLRKNDIAKKSLKAFGRARLHLLKGVGDHRELENGQRGGEGKERVEKQFNFNFYKNTDTTKLFVNISEIARNAKQHSVWIFF